MVAGGGGGVWCGVFSVTGRATFFFSFFRLCCDILKGVTSQRNMPRRKGQGISPAKSKYVLDCYSEIFQHDSQPVCSICFLLGLVVERREILPFQEGRVKNTSFRVEGEDRRRATGGMCDPSCCPPRPPGLPECLCIAVLFQSGHSSFLEF